MLRSKLESQVTEETARAENMSQADDVLDKLAQEKSKLNSEVEKIKKQISTTKEEFESRQFASIVDQNQEIELIKAVPLRFIPLIEEHSSALRVRLFITPETRNAKLNALLHLKLLCEAKDLEKLKALVHYILSAYENGAKWGDARTITSAQFTSKVYPSRIMYAQGSKRSDTAVLISKLNETIHDLESTITGQRSQLLALQTQAKSSLDLEISNYERKIKELETANTVLPSDIFIFSMPNAGVSHQELTSIMGTLSNTSKAWYNLFNTELVARAAKRLWQAIIDNDQPTVIRILNGRPKLLLVEPHDIVIESKYTWQKFYAEKALTMAVKRRLPEMVKLLLSYFNNLEQTSFVKIVKAEGLSAFSPYNYQKKEPPRYLPIEKSVLLDSIVIPEQYRDFARLLVNTFKEENIPNGAKGRLSEKTEEILSQLWNMLLPVQAIKLDKCPDAALFYLAMHIEYNNHYGLLAPRQRDVLLIRVIGLIQSFLTPAIATILCQSLYDVVERKQQISERAALFKLIKGESFYRASSESRSGLGFEYYCSSGYAVDFHTHGALPHIIEGLITAIMTDNDSMLLSSVQQSVESAPRLLGLPFTI